MGAPYLVFSSALRGGGRFGRRHLDSAGLVQGGGPHMPVLLGESGWSACPETRPGTPTLTEHSTVDLTSELHLSSGSRGWRWMN